MSNSPTICLHWRTCGIQESNRREPRLSAGLAQPVAASETYLADDRGDGLLQHAARVHDFTAVRHVRAHDRQHAAGLYGASADPGAGLHRRQENAPDSPGRGAAGGNAARRVSGREYWRTRYGICTRIQ